MSPHGQTARLFLPSAVVAREFASRLRVEELRQYMRLFSSQDGDNGISCGEQAARAPASLCDERDPALGRGGAGVSR